MDHPQNPSRFRTSVVLCLLVLVAAVGVYVAWPSRPAARSSSGEVALRPESVGRSGMEASGSLVPTSEVPLRPLPVSRKSDTHEWTEGDGRDEKLVERIAHNDEEFVKLMEENRRILKRQLVYRNDTAAAVIQRSKLSGEPVKHLVLPGVDGQEFDFEIARTDLSPSGQAGSFSGRLAGRGDSLVTLAFKFGRECFTVISPQDGVFLQAYPREPGEVIVTTFNPEVYWPAEGGQDHIVRPVTDQPVK